MPSKIFNINKFKVHSFIKFGIFILCIMGLIMFTISDYSNAKNYNDNAKNYKRDLNYTFNYSVKDIKVLKAPSIDDLKGVISLGSDQYLFYGDTKSFTQNGSDFLYVKIIPQNNDYFANVKVFSGLFNDNLISATKYGDYILAVGNTWSYSQDTLEDIMINVLDSNLNLVNYYVISGNRQEDVSNTVIVDNVPYILASTRSATFGKENSLIIKMDQNLNVDKIHLIGTNSEDKPYDLIKLSGDKYLLVGNYLKSSGNKDIYCAILDKNFNFIRAFAFGGAFDEFIKNTIIYKDKLIIVSQTRSFKPYEGENVLLNLIDLKSMKILRSLAIGNANDDYFLSSYIDNDKLILFIDNRVKDSSNLYLVSLNPLNLNIDKIVELDSFLSKESMEYFNRLRGFWVLDLKSNYIDLALNVVNTDTLEDYAICKLDNFIPQFYNNKFLRNFGVSKYYLRVSKFPNLESYDLVMNNKIVYSKDSSDNVFKIDNKINSSYLDFDISSIWK